MTKEFSAQGGTRTRQNKQLSAAVHGKTHRKHGVSATVRAPRRAVPRKDCCSVATVNKRKRIELMEGAKLLGLQYPQLIAEIAAGPLVARRHGTKVYLTQEDLRAYRAQLGMRR
jgi:hypothetical protein